MNDANYKILEIIQSITAKEERQLRKMLKSPFFTQRTDIQQLFELLMKMTKNDKKFPTIEEIAKDLFPQLPNGAIKVRGAMSDLKQFVEEYWCLQYLRKDKVKMHLMISEIYRRRKLQKCYVSNVKRIDSLMEKHPKRNADYYQLRLNFEIDRMKYQSATKRTEHLFLQEISDTTDILYLIQKLRNACAQLSHQLVFKTNYHNGLLNNVIKILEDSTYLSNPAIAIYYYCFRFLKDPEEVDFFHLFKSILLEHRDQFTKEDLEAPYRLAINFCIRKSNQGNKSFTVSAWELYKEGLATDILFDNELIPRFTFNNIIALALLLEEFDWTASFIKEKADHLEELHKAQTLSFNLARLAFAQGQYDQSLEFLQQAKYTDLLNNLISRMLKVKIFYEIQALDLLFSQLDTFEQYTRRKEVAEYHRVNFLTSIKYVRKLLSIPSFDKAAKVKLRNQILSEKILPEKKWLLEKCL